MCAFFLYFLRSIRFRLCNVTVNMPAKYVVVKSMLVYCKQNMKWKVLLKCTIVFLDAPIVRWRLL